MRKLAQDGLISRIFVILAALVVGFIVVLAFAVSSYSGEQKYKKNDNVLISQAVAQAKQSLTTQLNQQFALENQSPFVSYTGPSQYGSVYISYPKSWSGYVNTAGGNPVDGYFSPGVVPSVDDPNSIFALRLQINTNSYSSQLSQYTGNGNAVSISPFSLAKVPSVIGSMIQGQIQTNKQGVMVMLPLRTDTLEIWTESTQYQSLFTNQILPLVSFQP